jgi:hypothetical protein
MNIVKNNPLEKLAGFKIANTEVLKSIVGGFKEAVESKKKDVTSDKQDSASNDTFGG